jgi:hypothetical protein
MKIQINTDKNITGTQALSGALETIIENTLARFADQLSRVEVHLSDENSATKSTPEADKRCLLEARIEGQQPTSVTHTANNIEEATKGAAQKMQRALETHFGKLASR